MVGVNGSDDDVKEPRSGQELVQARPGPFVGLSDRLPGCLSDAAILLFFPREYSRRVLGCGRFTNSKSLQT